MNFGFTEEQELLREQIRRFLDGRAPMDTVREIMQRPDGFDPGLWAEMAELGWLGLTVDEAYGGAGMGWVDLVVLLEETGRSLLPSPLVSTLLAATAIGHFGTTAQKDTYLPGLADGSRIGALAVLEADGTPPPEGVALAGTPDGTGFRLTGSKHYVSDCGVAALFVVAFRTPDDGIALAIVERDAAGVGATSFTTIDLTKRLGTLTLDNVAVPAGAVITADGAGALARLMALGTVAVSAEAVGAAAQAHDITVRYAGERMQFGVPIGKFQGVKHPLAEMYVDVESCKSLVYYAAWAADQAPDELPLAASQAKAYVSDAFARIGIDGVQLHGAVGYTAEFDIQLFLKRSKWVRPAFGDADYHYERIVALGGV